MAGWRVRRRGSSRLDDSPAHFPGQTVTGIRAGRVSDGTSTCLLACNDNPIPIPLTSAGMLAEGSGGSQSMTDDPRFDPVDEMTDPDSSRYGSRMTHASPPSVASKVRALRRTATAMTDRSRHQETPTRHAEGSIDPR